MTSLNRFLDFASQIYTKGLDIEQGPTPNVQKEKKKVKRWKLCGTAFESRKFIPDFPNDFEQQGIFSTVIKDLKGTKAKTEINVEVEDERASIEELSTIFSTDNFPSEEEREENFTTNQDDLDLDIGTTFPILMIMFTAATLPPQGKITMHFHHEAHEAC